MKKIIITSILSSLICVASFGQTLYRTILSQNGQLTQYDVNHWTDAISNAVEGDTVYFTPGYFKGDITIEKAITIIGAGVSYTDAFYKGADIENAYDGCTTTGQSTFIEGNVIIAITTSPQAKPTHIEGIHVNKGDYTSNGNISITQPVTNLKIKKCQFISAFNAEATVDELVLENSLINTFNCANITTFDIHNCYFNAFNTNEREGLSISNCALPAPASTNCTYINCVLWGYPWEYINTYKNCAYDQGNSVSTYNNCYNVSNPQTKTKEELLAGDGTISYLGDDGEVVGPLGGTAPFTLIPSQPYVSSSTVSYNSTTNKLDVNITVKKGK